jgi:hypothetical protein
MKLNKRENCKSQNGNAKQGEKCPDEAVKR